MFARTRFAILAVVALTSPLVAKEPSPTISGPYTHGNLSVFLLHGKDALANGDKLMTLGEAIEKKKVIVHETANVNQLAIENVSDDLEVFVQSGDIVKGGQQDRLIACDLVLPPKSGRVPVSSFCCENGRWRQRGAESVTMFGASTAQAANREVKLALNSSRSQDEVWAKVKQAQDKLSANVGKPVANSASPSSYQLTLEDKNLLAKVEAYTKEMKQLSADHADSLGFVMAINGRIQGAELYGSHALFAKLWSKLLFSAAVDALSELDVKKTFAIPGKPEVEKFLTEASKGKETEVFAGAAANGRAPSAADWSNAPVPRPLPGSQVQKAVADGAAKAAKDSKLRVFATENDKTVLLEARERLQDIVVHRSYIAK